jgi:hypothetical protein
MLPSTPGVIPLPRDPRTPLAAAVARRAAAKKILRNSTASSAQRKQARAAIVALNEEISYLRPSKARLSG